MIHLRQAISHDPRERSAMLKAIAGKNVTKASFYLKRTKYKRNIAGCLAPLMLINAIRNFEKWTAIQPVEWNGLRFFAFIFSSLAVIVIGIYLVQQIRRVRMLNAFVRSMAM
jgi:hypothetical protein